MGIRRFPTGRRTFVVTLVALLTLFGVAAPAAHAATSIRAPWPVIEVEPGTEITIALEVEADPPQRVDLEVVAAPEDWHTVLRGGGFVVRAATPGEEELAEVDLDVAVPADAPRGSHRITISPLQAYRALPGDLPLVQSLLLVWPQVVGLVALLVVLFAAAYVSFLREEVRA